MLKVEKVMTIKFRLVKDVVVTQLFRFVMNHELIRFSPSRQCPLPSLTQGKQIGFGSIIETPK